MPIIKYFALLDKQELLEKKISQYRDSNPIKHQKYVEKYLKNQQSLRDYYHLLFNSRLWEQSEVLSFTYSTNPKKEKNK